MFVMNSFKNTNASSVIQSKYRFGLPVDGYDSADKSLKKQESKYCSLRDVLGLANVTNLIGPNKERATPRGLDHERALIELGTHGFHVVLIRHSGRTSSTLHTRGCTLAGRNQHLSTVYAESSASFFSFPCMSKLAFARPSTLAWCK